MTKIPLYVCATCGQNFTRRSNANRHNQNIHLGKAEIVRFLEYLVGRISGKYLPGDPLSYRRQKRNNKNKSIVHEYNNNLYNDISGLSRDNIISGTEYRQNATDDRTIDPINSKASNKTTICAVDNMTNFNNIFQLYDKVNDFLKKQEIEEKIYHIKRMLEDFYLPEQVSLFISDLYNKYNATTNYRRFYMELENYRRNLANRYQTLIDYK